MWFEGMQLRRRRTAKADKDMFSLRFFRALRAFAVQFDEPTARTVAHRYETWRTAMRQGAPSQRFGETNPRRDVSRGRADARAGFESHRALPTWQRFFGGCRNGIQQS